MIPVQDGEPELSLPRAALSGTLQISKPISFHILKQKPHPVARRDKRVRQRSVNSFIAFRTYYKPIFPKLQQKNASTFLTIMWKNDPFKAKWTIIAKAYSSIRDVVGKQRASLATFLILVCPKLGIINTKNYFKKMNWDFEDTADGIKVLEQTSFPDLCHFEWHILYTNITPKDIIQFCAQLGYIPQQIANQIAGEDYFNPIGSSPGNHRSQQGLLASCPVVPELDQPSTLLRGGSINSPLSHSPLVGSALAGNPVLFNERQGEESENLWTGSMFGLYNPLVGGFDIMLGEYFESSYKQPSFQN